MDGTDEELHRQVRSIVDELEAAVSGSLYRVHGEHIVIEDLDAWSRSGTGRRSTDVDEPDSVSLGEYLDERSLGDVRFEIDESKEVLGGKTLFCCGGPTIWVADDGVRGYWGSSRTEMSLDSMTRSAMLSWFREQWDAISR